MKKTFTIIISIAVVLTTFFVSPPSVEAGECFEQATVGRAWSGYIKSSVNLRTIPCMEGSEVIGSLSTGVSVSIIAENDGWYKVVNGSSQGWIWGSFLSITEYEPYENESYESEKYENESHEITIRLKGYILLQVENNGEAWYVHPDSSIRYYMKDGPTAYEMMRKFGLGITNVDLQRVKNGDQTLIARVKGKILLQVESVGEAYYVDPKTGAAHYMKNGAAAYEIMRYLSLGITNTDLKKIPDTEFKPLDTPTYDGSIALSGVSGDGNVYLDWTLNGFTSEKGFKVVKSLEANPVYPGDTYHYLSNSSTRSDTWTNLSPGTTYHFRVCEYLGGACGVYSNDIAVTISGTTSSSSGSISLSGVSDDGNVYLDWNIDGFTSNMGFKVVKSLDANPVYPGDTYHYLSSSSIRSDTWTNLSPGTTYHFRVCEYLGSSCGIYSNDIAVTVSGTTSSSSGSISLSGVSNSGKVYLDWDLDGFTSDMGFKVVKSLDANPVYPGDTYHYLSSSSTRSDTWTSLSPGTTYHFRVCEYLGGACGVYSNDIAITVSN